MPICSRQAVAISLAGWLSLLSLPLIAANESKPQYAEATVDMVLKQVSEHVWYVEGVPGIATDNQGFISNSGFVVTGEGVVVFDALGTPSLANKLLKLIREVTDEPIKKVITSHYHADHIYGLQVFEDLGAEIIAPAGVSRYLKSDAAKERLEERQFSLDPWVNENTRLVIPDRLINEALQFKLGEVDFTVSYLGAAHSDADQTMFIEPDKVLFSGDIIFEGRIPFVGNGDTGEWLETLRHMETDGLKVLVPGHGPASTSPAETIALTRRYIEYMREKMGAAVDEFEPFTDVYEATDWSEFSDLPAFADGNRINAYQVYLSMEAELLQE